MATAAAYVDSGTDADGEDASAAVNTKLVLGAEERGSRMSPPASPPPDSIL